MLKKCCFIYLYTKIQLYNYDDTFTTLLMIKKYVHIVSKLYRGREQKYVALLLIYLIK